MSLQVASIVQLTFVFLHTSINETCVKAVKTSCDIQHTFASAECASAVTLGMLICVVTYIVSVQTVKN